MNPIQIRQKSDIPAQRGHERGYATINPGQVELSRWLRHPTSSVGDPGAAQWP